MAHPFFDVLWNVVFYALNEFYAIVFYALNEFL